MKIEKELAAKIEMMDLAILALSKQIEELKAQKTTVIHEHHYYYHNQTYTWPVYQPSVPVYPSYPVYISTAGTTKCDCNTTVPNCGHLNLSGCVTTGKATTN